MITIKGMTVTKPFKYLWLKHITGIDLSVHCAKCLKGEYISRINNRITTEKDICLQDGIYYLCGVSLPYVWDNNFHLAFAYSQGETIDYCSNGIHILIKNARALPISTEYIDWGNPKAKSKAYNTCRNWQFAHYLNKGFL